MLCAFDVCGGGFSGGGGRSLRLTGATVDRCAGELGDA